MRISWQHRPFSLATRLTFFISLSTTVAFVAFTWMMLHSVEQHFAEQDINDLQQISMTLENILKTPDTPEQQKVARLSDALKSYRNISVLLKNQQQQVLYHSHDGPDLLSVPELPQAAGEQVIVWSGVNKNHEAHGGGPTTWRLINAKVTSSENGKAVSYHMQIALSIDFHLHYINQLKHNLVLIAAAISLMIIIIVLIAVHKGHQPLRNVSQKIKNISSENLDVRLDPRRVPIELEQLVISFNQMLARIEDVFTRQANFSADIAHEIRTPITNLVTQTEIALSQRRTEQELEDVLYSNLEEYHRMAKMVSDMLFLAQADNNQLIPERSLLDLRSETLKVFEFFEAWAEEQEVSLTLEGSPALIEGDPLMLRRVINNLLSNAIRHTPRGMAVTVSISSRHAWVDLTVENPGPPIPPEHLPRVFDRFYRVDPSRQRKSEGSGIGLAIVKSIVTAHQGKISVASDAVSTRFTLSFPRYRQQAG
ncbi:Cu(+)/Ag(+) sensor histidine kinase [Erwinia sorbitola]|uniref:Sensor protein n=1 Tax=Erwinia sorbitola TaxID=2681984 RepID=A0A6I6ETQ8_9GAMM|nr:Cu(+)/Ag(+) sensor histidine kinase [Erwinia sorbitola]MTD25526.1 heavy metal sensor histidine kinase [Erwinia sorbitola]QGU87912.1 heavy metal sensor histidine kinase [Erwinia sorbitola]